MTTWALWSLEWAVMARARSYSVTSTAMGTTETFWLYRSAHSAIGFVAALTHRARATTSMNLSKCRSRWNGVLGVKPGRKYVASSVSYTSRALRAASNRSSHGG